MQDDINHRIDDLERRVKTLEEKFSVPINISTIEKQQSPQEFLQEITPDTSAKKTVTLGYYLEKYRTKNSFIIGDIKKLYIEAREPVPTNIAVDISGAIKRAWLMQLPDKEKGKGIYTLTSKGQEAVKNKFRESGEGKSN